MEETKMTAALPGLDVEIIRRELAEENAEAVTIRLRATPSFDAVVRSFLPQATVLALLGATPMALWTEMAAAAWRPWLTVLGAWPRLGDGVGPSARERG